MAVFDAFPLASATDKTACVLDFDASLKTYAQANSIFRSDATYSITIDDREYNQLSDYVNYFHFN